MSELFYLSDPLASAPGRFDFCEKNSGRFSVQYARELLRGDIKPSLPIELCARMGSRLLDVHWGVRSGLLIFSTKAIAILERSGITGWQEYPVNIYTRDGVKHAGYSGIALTGRVARLDLQKMKIISKPPVSEMGKPYAVYKGIVLPADAWDGSDMCLIGPSTHKVVTSKFVEAFRLARVKNVIFTPLKDVEMDVRVLEKLMNGE